MEQRTRSTEEIVIRTLTFLIAAVFVVTGVAKITGFEPIGLQAAAMRGFPDWVRIVVGLAEVIGAVALLTPAVAFAAAMLAGLMVPATITQWISGEPGVIVPVILAALLLLVAWRRAPQVAQAGYSYAFRTPRPLLREGMILGVIGATIIAVWFFVIDVVAGNALFTPATMGRSLLRMLAPGSAAATGIGIAVLTYTLVHYTAFIVLGLSLSLLVNVAQREPSILLGFVVVFVAMEVGFYAFSSMLQQATPLGALAWYNVMAGNLLAATGMGVYLWRAHPALREQFQHALDPQPAVVKTL